MGSNCDACKKIEKTTEIQNTAREDNIHKLELSSLENDSHTQKSFHRKGPSYFQFDEDFHPARDMKKSEESSLESIEEWTKKVTLKQNKEMHKSYSQEAYLLNRNNQSIPSQKKLATSFSTSLQNIKINQKKGNAQRASITKAKKKTPEKDQRHLKSELHRKKKESYQLNQRLFKFFNDEYKSQRNINILKKQNIVSQYKIQLNKKQEKMNSIDSLPMIKINGRSEKRREASNARNKKYDIQSN